VSISALLGGSVDAAVIGTVNNWLLAEQGMKAKSIVGIAMRSTNVLVVRSDLDVQADDPASLVKALKGKRFGVASLGSGGDMVASGVLEEFGSKSGDFVKVAVGVGGTALAALKSGAVDGLVTYEPDLTQIVRSGAGKIALDLRSTQAERLFSRLPTTTLMARSEWIDKNQDVAQKLIKAVVRANTTLRDDPDTSVKVLGKLYPSIQLGDIKAIYNGERGGFRSTLEKEEFELAQNTYLKAKAISKSYPFEELNDVRFAPLWT
jgi:NitT/TauT family transport system substrate-binding protein